MIPDLALEIFLLLLAFFIAGCIIGCIARRNWDLFFGGTEQPGEATQAAKAPPARTVKTSRASKPKTPADAPKPSKPRGLKNARAAGADDLKRISGIGPALEKKLNALGYYHFDQIAKWSRANVAWVDDNLNFKGRIDRDDWIEQAKALAK